MQVASAAETHVEYAHNKSISVWWLSRPRVMRGETEGGFLELISEFQVEPEGEVFPHSHPTHEWYYVVAGRGTMVIGDEERQVDVGDLVYIPPNAIHSMRSPADATLRCLCFAFALPDAPEIDYAVHE
jgi:mannose-6-phosphate isomerase-like protein (cupin superfamily)